MAATGPHKNTYIISDLVLGDTFEQWFTVTNTKIIDKLNRLKVYTATGNEGITANTDDAGLLTVGLETIIPSDHTFTGNITFNGETTTVNSFDLNVDDYNLVLGATGVGGSTMGDDDATVGTGGSIGGGVIIRGSSGDKSILWKYPRDAFIVSDHVGLSGGMAIGSVGNNLGLRDMHTHGVSAGLQFGFTASTGITGATTQMGATGSTAGSRDLLVSYITEHSVSGTTHEVARINSDAFVQITNGVNRKRVFQENHGFTFGFVLRRAYSTETDNYVLSQADDKKKAEVVGVVSRVIDDNTFDITFSGEIVAEPGQTWQECLTNGLTELSPGNAFFLSHTTAGKLSITPPTAPGKIRKPVITALDENRALVTNYIGHEIPNDEVLASAGQSNRRMIEQVNDFEIGDVLRFDPDTKYGFSGGSQFTGITYDHGTYRKAQANSKEEAEVVGIVSDKNVLGDTKKFYLTTGGYFTLPTAYGLTAGQVYFLTPNSAGSTASNSLSLDSPKTIGMVRKPLLTTSSDAECYFHNYVGTTITETINADRLQPLVGRTFQPVTTREQIATHSSSPGQWPSDGTGFAHGIINLNENSNSLPSDYTGEFYDNSSSLSVPDNATHAMVTFRVNLAFNSESTHNLYVTQYSSNSFQSTSWKTPDNAYATIDGSYDRHSLEVKAIVPITSTSDGTHIMYAFSSSTSDGPLNHSISVDGFFIDDSEVLVPNPSGTYRNKIINGNFDFWQREVGLSGSSSTATTNDFYTADRWTRKYNTGTPDNFSLEQGTFAFSQTEVPHYPTYYMRHSGVLIGATATNSAVTLEQKIEDVRTLAGENATVSFWAKGTATGSIQVAVKQDFGSGGDAGNGDTIAITPVMGCDIGGGWNKYTGTVAVPVIGTTASAGSNHNLSLQFYTYSPSGGSAGNTEHIAYDGVLEISQVQVEEGAKASNFDLHEPEIELARCQRYYWQDAAMSFYVDGTAGSPSPNQGNAVGTLFFPTTMRAAPTMTTGYVATTASATSGQIGTRTAQVTLTVGDIVSSDAQITGFKADAEL